MGSDKLQGFLQSFRAFACRANAAELAREAVLALAPIEALLPAFVRTLNPKPGPYSV